MDGKPPDPKNYVGVSSSLGSGGNDLATGIGSDRERSVNGPGFLVIASSGFEGNHSVGGISRKSGCIQRDFRRRLRICSCGSTHHQFCHNSGCDNYRSDGVGRDVRVAGSKPYWQAEEDALTVDSAHSVAEEDALNVDFDHGLRRKSGGDEDERARHSTTPASNSLPSRIVVDYHHKGQW
ncbi:hypothetical protein AMTR_s00123p00061740 [Amborella trichopoda]|uniref:Uncharacterized protein n=1 Tax=Amborella trichopoda TaxID=13333 RepID=W1NRZ0_AMBTC|nr:hypothetical protein AMTR_s00123p00061740 [Amborella trichopoda]